MKNRFAILITLGALLMILMAQAACLGRCPSKPPHHGAFLKKDCSFIEMEQKGLERPLPSDEGVPHTSEKQPLIVVWDPDVIPRFLVLSGAKYDISSKEDGVLELRPREPLSPGMYCLSAGHPLLSPADIPHWYFVVEGTVAGEAESSKATIAVEVAPTHVSPSGQSVVIGNWRLTIASVDTNTQSIDLGGNRVITPKEGFRFVVVTLVVENVSKDIARFESSDFPCRVLADKGYVYTGQLHLGGMIPPQFRIRGPALIEVPIVATGLQLVITPKGDEDIVWALDRQYQAPDFTFPTDGSGFLQIGDTITVPEEIAVTVEKIGPPEKGFQYFYFSVENLGGYTIAIERDYDITMDIFNNDGSHGFDPGVVGLSGRGFDVSIPPDYSKQYNYGDRLFSATKASKLVVLISGKGKTHYGIYDIDFVRAAATATREAWEA